MVYSRRQLTVTCIILRQYNNQMTRELGLVGVSKVGPIQDKSVYEAAKQFASTVGSTASVKHGGDDKASKIGRRTVLIMAEGPKNILSPSESKTFDEQWQTEDELWEMSMQRIKKTKKRKR